MVNESLEGRSDRRFDDVQLRKGVLVRAACSLKSLVGKAEPSVKNLRRALSIVNTKASGDPGVHVRKKKDVRVRGHV